MIHDHDESPSGDGEDLQGRYANYFVVGHNAVEFLFDFGQFYLGRDRGRLHTRIVTSPIYAKALLAILRESIDRYEQTFGAITQHESD